MLPALQEIGGDLGVPRGNDAQLVISALFLGLAVGTMIYGPISDSTGRKPPIYAGFALFILGCLLSVVATSFPVMLVGRFLQGLGAAGPRIVAIASDEPGCDALAEVALPRLDLNDEGQIANFIIAHCGLAPTAAAEASG